MTPTNTNVIIKKPNTNILLNEIYGFFVYKIKVHRNVCIAEKRQARMRHVPRMKQPFPERREVTRDESRDGCLREMVSWVILAPEDLICEHP